MKGTVLHFSGWGQPTLDYFSMVNYYAQDRISVKILKSYLPICYAVIPTTVIRFYVNCPETFEVIRIYPGGESRKNYDASPRTLEAFRKIWKGAKKGWTAERSKDLITLTFKGSLIPLPYRLSQYNLSR